MTKEKQIRIKQAMYMAEMAVRYGKRCIHELKAVTDPQYLKLIERQRKEKLLIKYK